MNERQQKKFEELAKGMGLRIEPTGYMNTSPQTYDGTPATYFAYETEKAYRTYSAACQDEAERAQALVAAVEWMLDAFSTVANSEAQIESHSAVADALAAYKGDAK
jgi:penicillin V acylase-like amidase (Ntn superfamily)